MFNHKITYCLMLSVAMLLSLTLGLSSCVYDDYPEVETQSDDPTVDPNAYNVSFLLSVGNAETRASSDYSESTENGDDDMYENKIDLEKGLRIFFFMATNNQYGFSDSFIQELTICSAEQDENYKNLYRVTAKLDPDYIPTGDFRFVVIANWHNNKSVWPNNKDLYYLTNYEYTMFVYPCNSGDSSWQPSADFPIPMYGVKNFVSGSSNYPQFKKGATVDMGQIELLRSVAKIEVFTKKYSSMKIEDMKLTYFMPVAMAAPKLMVLTDTQQATSITLNLMGDENSASRTYLTSLNYSLTENNATPYQNLMFRQKDDDNYYHYYAYVPEYRNVNGSAPVTKITFRAKSASYPDGKDYELEFKNYETGVHFDILRNYIYRYYVDFSTKIQYVVEPWTELTAGDIIFE